MNGKQQQAIHRIEELCGARSARQYEPWICVAATWSGSESLFSRIASAGGLNQVMDYLAEVRFGLVFRHLGFALAMEPSGRKGPDLEVSRGGVSALVEISRFVPANPGPPDSGGELLAEYGNPARDVAKSLAKIESKFRQLPGELSILALWNDDDALEELEMLEAVTTATALPDRPASLQFLLFGSAWHRLGCDLLCFPFEPMNDSMQPWIDDLQAVNMSRVYVETATAGAGGAA